MDNIKICSERSWPNRGECFTCAVNENPKNLDHKVPTAAVILALNLSPAPYTALLFERKWKTGRELKISFLGDVDNTVKQRIIFYANQWLEFVNLRFNFINDIDGDIRISTEPGGSWSYLGTDALLVKNNLPTMNYGWLLPDTPDEEYSRVVLHEFGHALGAIHEHMHPDAGIPWDRPKVYDYYSKMGWTADEVDNNIFKKYDKDQLNTSTYDKSSIMHYAVPDELTIGHWEIAWNTELSDSDKKFITNQYPR